MAKSVTETETQTRVAVEEKPSAPSASASVAYRLRLQGHAEAEIPDMLALAGADEPLTEAEVRQAVDEAAARVRDSHSEATAVALGLARLDAMLQGLWPAATTGEVAAVDRVLRLEERRDKLLGLATEAARQEFLNGGGEDDLAGLSKEELQLLEKIQEKRAQRKSTIGSRGTRGGRPSRKGGGS